MRSKTPLALMEQLVMILVFALAAAMCMRIFVGADRLSKKNEAVSNAALAAQNVAEEMKSRGCEFARLYHGYEDIWAYEDETWILAFDKEWAPVTREESETEVQQKYWLQVCEEPEEIPGLVRTQITVTDGKDVLFTIPAAWQEVSGHE